MAVELECSFEGEGPEWLPVYELEGAPGRRAAGARLRELAERLDLGVPFETCEAPGQSRCRSGSWELAIDHRSGALSARRQPSRELRLEASPEDAVAVAELTLDRVECGNRGDRRVERVTHLRLGGLDADGTSVDEVLDTGVVFRREVEGRRVDGPGGHAFVKVSGTAEVFGVAAVWRPVATEVAEVEIVPPDEPLTRLREIDARSRGELVVKRASLSYFEHGAQDSQKFLQPAYVVVYEIRDGLVGTRSALVEPASRDVFEPFVGRRRYARTREPRPRADQPSRSASRRSRKGRSASE